MRRRNGSARSLTARGGEAMSKIRELRILPPFAIARLGSSDEPMDNYSIEIDPPPANATDPLGYRALKPLPTLKVDDETGEIHDVVTPSPPLRFKTTDPVGGKDRIRPVAPFLEVFAVTEDSDDPVPLTIDLLEENGYAVEHVTWSVELANRKVARRTGDENDVVATGEVTIDDHSVYQLV